MIEIRQEFAPITHNPLYMLFNEKGQLGVIYDIGQSGIWGYEYWGDLLLDAEICRAIAQQKVETLTHELQRKGNGYALQYVPDELKSKAVCAKAVERNGDALQYVFEKSLFVRIAAKFGIRINISDPTAKAVKAYAAYCKQAGGLTFDGKPLPTFEELGEDRQACWMAAAEELAV